LKMNFLGLENPVKDFLSFIELSFKIALKANRITTSFLYKKL